MLDSVKEKAPGSSAKVRGSGENAGREADRTRKHTITGRHIRVKKGIDGDTTRTTLNHQN